MKEGSEQDKESAFKALGKAKSLIQNRLERLTDTNMHVSLINNVPLIKEILEIKIPSIA
jgi:hypothetical protein